MAGLPAGGFVCPYRAINYLLFRVYEAAHQLKTAIGSRCVVIVIDELAWHRFQVQIKENWIDWVCPHFINPDGVWNEFLAHHEKHYPGLPSDVATTIRAIDSIMVFRQKHDFEFHLERTFSSAAYRFRS